MALTDAEYDRLILEESERTTRSRSPRGTTSFEPEEEGTWILLPAEGWCMVWYARGWKPTKFELDYKKAWQPSWWKKIST